MEDTPPLLPASLPPSLESRNASHKRSTSKKILSLQAQLSSSKTMYSGGLPKAVPPAVRPKPSVKPKRSASEAEETDSNIALGKPINRDKRLTLTHRTMERPKRKGIRTPSHGSQGILPGLPSNQTPSSDVLPSLPISAPPDFDQPPPLPTSAPPPNEEHSSESLIPTEIDSFSATADIANMPGTELLNHLQSPSYSESPPPLPVAMSELPLDEPPSPSPPIEALSTSEPPLISESPILSHTPVTSLVTETANESPLSNLTSLPPPILNEIPPANKSLEGSCLVETPESPLFDAPPSPQLPLSCPPEDIDKDNKESLPSTFHIPVTTTSSHGLAQSEKEEMAHTQRSPMVTPELSSAKQQKRAPSPLTSSYSAWNTNHSSTAITDDQSSDEKSDHSLNSSNASFVKLSSAITSSTISDVKLSADDKTTSNASKFRERIARLKQKREGLMPSPAMSVQSEVAALSSRVTSPLLSSYSATLLEPTDNYSTSSCKPQETHFTNISPPLISTESFSQSTPISQDTTNFLHFASNPPTLSSDIKLVEPFTVKRIRISSTSITPESPGDVLLSSQPLAPISSIDNSLVKLHSDSAFSKPQSSGITDNAVILSGLPSDIPESNFDDSHANDENDSDSTPPPLPSSLPPDAFESDNFFDQADIISDNIPPPDLPSIPPPILPAAASPDEIENEMRMNDAPPLPTSPIPFEPPSTEQPFIEPPSLEPPGSFAHELPSNKCTVEEPKSQSLSEEPQISAPAEFSTTEVLHNSQDRKSGLQTEMFLKSSPKASHLISHYSAKDLSQVSSSTGSSHLIHFHDNLKLDKCKSSSLPMFVCEQLVSQPQDDESSSSKALKSSKKSASKLRFPWQKRVGHDRSYSMSEERPKKKSRKSSKEGYDRRHSSIDIKQDVTDNGMVVRDKDVNRLQVDSVPVTPFASVGDLRRARPPETNVYPLSASHSELSKRKLAQPPVLSVTACLSASSIEKSPKDEQGLQTLLSHKYSLRDAESNISLPHMTTPELYRKLTQPSDPSLLESVMKDIPLFSTTTSLTETAAESSEKPLIATQQNEKEVITTTEVLPSQNEESSIAGKDQTDAINSEGCLDSNLNESMESYGVPPSPGSPLSDKSWSPLAANTPDIQDRRHSTFSSFSTLLSEDSQQDLSKRCITIGDWNVDHVIQWLQSVGLSSVVPVFRQFSIDGAKLKSLDDARLTEIGIHTSLLRKQILQETWELLIANNEAVSKSPRKTSSLLQGMSVIRKGLESQLKDRISEDLTLLQTMGKQQEEMLDGKLAAVRGQQEQVQELLQGGLTAGEDEHRQKQEQQNQRRRKSSMPSVNPENWSVNQVCEWLDLVGLGYYITAFQEHQIDGSALCSLDMQTFAEIGVDSEEDRELILAQIYELFNPESESYGDYDDLEEKYSGEELEKIKAAISALKNPLLADDVEIESSPSPFYFDFADSDELMSRSVPVLTDIQYDDDSAPGTPNPRLLRQGSIPLSRAHNRRYSRQSYINHSNHEFTTLQLKGSSARTSTTASLTPPLPVKRASTVIPDYDDTTNFSELVQSSQAPVVNITPPLASEAADATERDTAEYTTKLASKLAAKRRGSGQMNLDKTTQPAAAAAASSGNKEAANKMKELAIQLSHGAIKLEGGASGVKADSEGNRPGLVTKKTRAGFGKKINTVKIKAGGMQSGLLRLYMVDIPHFAHVIYQAYLISSNTTSHELIEQVINKADIVDDPYRYYVYENSIDETDNDQGLILERDDCPLQIQMEWVNFYGKRFELRCRPVHLVNVTTEIDGIPNTTRPIHITNITPCSVLIAIAMATFQIDDSYKNLKLVAVQTKNKKERELQDTDIPMGFLTAKNAKWVVFSLRETTEPENIAITAAQNEGQNVQPANSLIASAAATATTDISPEAVMKTQPSKEVVSRPNVNQMSELEKKCSLLENEKMQLAQQLDDLQKRCSAVVMESSNEALVVLENENNKLMGELIALKNKSVQDANSIEELSENVRNLEKILMGKEKQMITIGTMNEDLLRSDKQMQDQLGSYENQQKLNDDTLQSLKDTLETLDGNLHHKQEMVVQLKHENENLQRLLHEKEEQLNSSSVSSNNDHTVKASLSKAENEASVLTKQHERQTLQLKAAEEQINSMIKVLNQKDEVITQLSNIEPWKNTHPRGSLNAMIGAEAVGTLFSVAVEPQEKGLGIKLSSTEGEGCLVMEVADHSPLVSTVQRGDRLLEINGEDVSSGNTKLVVSLLKNLREPMHFVILRSGAFITQDTSDTADEDMVERLQKLNTTLTEQVEKQMSETQYWRSQYEQIQEISSANASLQQEKDSEILYHISTIKELEEQITENSITQEQLQAMLEELHHKHDQHSKEATASLDQAFQEHAEQVEALETSHKNKIQALQDVIKEKERTVQLFRQHLVLTHPIEPSSLQAKTKGVDSLTTASQAEVLEALKDSESECARHQAYLDQLLVLVIERCPELLNTMSSALDNTRSNAEEWC